MTVHIDEQLSRQGRIQNTVKDLRLSVPQNEKCLSARMQQETFQGTCIGGLWELGHLDKSFVKTQGLEVPQGNILEIFPKIS